MTMIERILGSLTAFLLVIFLFLMLIGFGIGLFLTSLIFLGVAGIWALVDSRKGFIIPLIFVLGIFLLITYTVSYKQIDKGVENETSIHI